MRKNKLLLAEHLGNISETLTAIIADHRVVRGRGRGRGRGGGRTGGGRVVGDDKGVGEVDRDNPPLKRKRGRPPKAFTLSTGPKKMGRPRKQQESEEESGDEDEDEDEESGEETQQEVKKKKVGGGALPMSTMKNMGMEGRGM